MQHKLKVLTANDIMHLRHDIWFKLSSDQRRKLYANGYDWSNLDTVPMEIFKRVTKAEYLHERLVRVKRGSFRLYVN